MFKRLRNCIFLFPTTLAFAGCMSISNTPPSEELIDGRHFPKHSTYQIESIEDIFELNNSAKDFLDQISDDHRSKKAQLGALVYNIFDRSKLALAYEADANTTATQTYEKGAANCLSLTIMAYAMAEYLGFDATFQEVNIPEYWTRRDGNILLNGHVNLHLLEQEDYDSYALQPRPFIIDFDPLRNTQRFKTTPLSKRDVVSNFYVNKAADALIKDNNDLAFAYLKAAIDVAPSNEGAYVNLGVLYSRNNLFNLAELAYQASLDIKSNFSTALENLSLLYQKTDRLPQAKSIQARLAKKRENNPYYHFFLGNLSFDKGEHKQSLEHYKKSISLNSKPHEFYFHLARTFLVLGDLENTKRYLRKAKKRAGNENLERRYEHQLSLIASR
jgi:tetratricopeptide (TPR) repeat protein